jgi:serine/threonine protein kinase
VTFAESNRKGLAGLPLAQRIDGVCDAFEAEWLANRTPRAEDFLAGFAGAERVALLRELLALEVDYRRRRGPPPGVDEYAARFPGDREVVGQVLGPLTQAQTPPMAPSTAAHSPPLENFSASEAAFGQYRLLEKLGEGGMGVVYKAIHLRLEKQVAIKIVAPERTANPEAVARFEREMKAVGRLHHPNIVNAFDAGEFKDSHYLVMELIDGVDLAVLLQAHAPLAVPDACELVRQAALGLQHAHEHGMVHRDIKPSNLMLTGVRRRGAVTGVVKVLDLGLALLDEWRVGRTPSALTSTGRMMGSIEYMAPEQAIDTHRVDIRADVYSLGATLYALLTGTTPFDTTQHDSAIQRLSSLVHDPRPSLRSHATNVPDELASLVDRMLARDPADRPATPELVANALEPFAAGHAIPELLAASGKGPRQGSTIRGAVPPKTLIANRSASRENTSQASSLARRDPNSRSRRATRYWGVGCVVVLAVAAMYAIFGPRNVFRTGKPVSDSPKRLNEPEQNSETRMMAAAEPQQPSVEPEVAVLDLLQDAPKNEHGELTLEAPFSVGRSWRTTPATAREYTLEVQVARTVGSFTTDIVLSRDDRIIVVRLDQDDVNNETKRYSGIAGLDHRGSNSPQNPTSREGKLLNDPDWNRIVCHLAEERIAVDVNGRRVIDWSELDRCHTSAEFQRSQGPWMGLVQWAGSLRCNKFELRPLDRAALTQTEP